MKLGGSRAEWRADRVLEAVEIYGMCSPELSCLTSVSLILHRAQESAPIVAHCGPATLKQGKGTNVIFPLFLSPAKTKMF